MDKSLKISVYRQGINKNLNFVKYQTKQVLPLEIRYKMS
jgi:hypothetical protein